MHRRTVEASSKHTELQSFKAEIRAKTIAVGKAEIILNDVCLSMARRVGRAEGVQVSESKGGVLLEVCECARPHRFFAWAVPTDRASSAKRTTPSQTSMQSYYHPS